MAWCSPLCNACIRSGAREISFLFSALKEQQDSLSRFVHMGLRVIVLFPYSRPVWSGCISGQKNGPVWWQTDWAFWTLKRWVSVYFWHDLTAWFELSRFDSELDSNDSKDQSPVNQKIQNTYIVCMRLNQEKTRKHKTSCLSILLLNMQHG